MALKKFEDITNWITPPMTTRNPETGEMVDRTLSDDNKTLLGKQYGGGINTRKVTHDAKGNWDWNKTTDKNKRHVYDEIASYNDGSKDYDDYIRENMPDFWEDETEQQLTNALDNGNNEQVENIIEKNPIETSKILPENSPLQNEAKEVTDGDKRTDRVDNEVIKDSIDDYHTPGGFLNQNQNGKLKDEVIDDDFFENFAKGLKSTENADKYQAEDTFKPTGSIYSTPKINRASHSDYINGKIDRNEYMNQLSNQSSQAGEALDRASQMMKDERERYDNEGGRFDRGHVGAYALPAGNAKNFADNRLNEMNEGFADIDAKAYSKNYKPKFYKGEDDLTISDMPEVVEEIIEKEPEIIKEEVPEDNPIYKEAEQVTDGDKRTDRANDEKVKEGIKNDNGIDWDAIESKWYAEHEAITNPSSEYKDEFGRDVPDFVSKDEALSEYFGNTDELYDYLMNNGYGDDVFDPGLEDQNQYPVEANDLDETIAQENVPEVNENDFVKSDVLPSADNVLELKPEEQKVVTEAIEENAPEEEKEAYFGMLGLPHRQLGGSSHGSVNANNNNEQYKLDRLSHAGAPSIGRIGGFSTGSGSVTPGTTPTSVAKPHAMTENTPSRAGGGSIPKSPTSSANLQVGSKPGTNNNGFVTSNGGNMSSGPVQKRSSLKMPKPAQLPNFTGHTAPIQQNPLGSSKDLHEALIERIKNMIDNLDAETRKKLGFSPTLYNYNGTPLDKLDGATLSQLSEMLEGMQNG